MTRFTPRATPVAPVPALRVNTPAVQAAPRPPLLEAPAMVVGAGEEHELRRGYLTVGRLPGSDIHVDDPLVSREHARILVDEDGIVAVEDLHSTNGIYVNGIRVARARTRLSDGDRILVGTTELSLFAARNRRSETPGQTPALEPPPSRNVLLPSMQRSDSVPSTARADAIDVIGKLATRHAEKGNVAEAVRILSTHLNKVLLGATAGLPVREVLLDRATYFALELHRWTQNPAWVDYTIELYLASQAVPSDTGLTLLSSVLENDAIAFDRELLAYLVEKLAARRDLGQDDQLRLARLRRLQRPR